MKRYDPQRADDRQIHEKAFGLIYAMTDEQAQLLHEMLGRMAQCKGAGCDRARMFLGTPKAKP